jgi:hypothetical protein
MLAALPKESTESMFLSDITKFLILLKSMTFSGTKFQLYQNHTLSGVLLRITVLIRRLGHLLDGDVLNVSQFR